MNWINILVSVALIILTLIFVIKMIVEYKKSKSIDEKVLFWGVGIVVFFLLHSFI